MMFVFMMVVKPTGASFEHKKENEARQAVQKHCTRICFFKRLRQKVKKCCGKKRTGAKRHRKKECCLSAFFKAQKRGTTRKRNCASRHNGKNHIKNRHVSSNNSTGNKKAPQ